MYQGSIFFSKNNIIVKIVIWGVIIAFVLSIFIFAGTFHLSYKQNQAIQDLKDLNKGKISDADYNKILATVKLPNENETINITAGDYYDIYHRQDENFRKFYTGRKKREELLDQIIEYKLVERMAKKIIPTKKDYDDELKRIFPDQKQLEEYLKATNMTREQLEDKLTPQVQERLLKKNLFKPRIIPEETLRSYYESNKKEFTELKVLPGESKETEIVKSFDEVKQVIYEKLLKIVTDEDIRKYYEEHKAKYKNPPAVDLAHIFIKSGSEAIKSKINPTEDELKKYYNENKEKYKTSRAFEIKTIVKPYESSNILNSITPTDTEVVEYYNKNISKFMTRAYLDLKNILIDPKAKHRVDSLKFNDEDLKNFYNQTDEVKASHILVKDETQAIEIKKKLDEGANFEELAKTYSTCPSKDKGGDLGFFKRETMVKPFSDAAFSMKIGEISNPVKTDFGYHIIKVYDQKTKYSKPFDEIKDQVKNDYIETELDRKAKELAEEIVKKIKNGEKFEELAKKYSDGHSKENGGNLGKIYQDNKEPIENIEKLSGEVALNGKIIDSILYTAFSLQSDTTPSEVLKTPLGYHVIMMSNKVDSKVRPLDECKDDVILEYKKEIAKEKVYDLLKEAHDKITKGGFKFEEIQSQLSESQSAKENKVCGKIYLGETPKDYDKSGLVGEIIKNANDEIPYEITNALSKLTYEGQITDVIKLPWAAVILKAEKIYEPTYKPFDEVKDTVKKEFIDYKAEEMSKQILSDAKKRIYNGEAFDKLALEISEGVTKDKGGKVGIIIKGEGFKDKSLVEKFKNEICMPWGNMVDQTIEETAFSLENDTCSDVIKSMFGFHILKVLERINDSYKDISEVKDKIKELLSKSSLVSEEEIKNYYEQHKHEYSTPERVKVRIIVLPTEEEAKKVYNELVNEKKDFAELAKLYSKDLATKNKGGDMGFITRGQVHHTLENVAFNLGVGQISNVFKSPAGYNIIQVTEKEAPKVASLEEKRAEIMQILSTPKENELFREYMTELRNLSEIKYKKENFELLTKYE